MKLKEKAANEASAEGMIKPFFFGQNNGRFAEADRFLQLKKSLSEFGGESTHIRLLASTMKKKLKNKAKRQEKMSFGGKKGKRKFNLKFKGQLISKCPFGVIVSTKIPTKKFDNFCPRIWKVVKS